MLSDKKSGLYLKASAAYKMNVINYLRNVLSHENIARLQLAEVALKYKQFKTLIYFR